MNGMTTTQYPSDERRYTTQELAVLWQCSPDVIYDLLKQGRLRGFKVGTGWRITESAVRAYEESPENQNPRPYPRAEPRPRQAAMPLRVV